MATTAKHPDDPNGPKPQDEIVDKLFNLNEISKPARDQRLLEARITFALACVLIMLGAGLIFWEALQSPSQILTAKTAVGALMSLVGGGLLKLHKSAHEQLEQIRKDQDAQAMILLIKNDAERDKALRDYALRLNEKKGFWKRLTGG